MFTSPRCCHVIASLFSSLPLPMLTPPSRPSLGPHSARRGKLLHPRRRPNTNSQWQFESVRLTASWLWLRTVTERQAEGCIRQPANSGKGRRSCLVLLHDSFTGLHGPVCGSGEHKTGCGGRTPIVSQGGRGAVSRLRWEGSLRKRAPTFDVDVRDGDWKLFRPRCCLDWKGGFSPSHLD